MDSLLEVFASENSGVEYLYSKNILKDNRKCPRCRKDMVFEKYRLFRCPNRKCLKQKSILSKIFLDTAKIGVNKVLQISYLFLIGSPIVGIIEATALSSATVTECTRFIRQLLADNVDLSDTIIGGKDIIAEVDETKLGKRKYHKGHRVEVVWVVACIEVTKEKRCFVVEVENRDAKTIKDILSRHILPDTIVYTDIWKAYNQPCNDLNLEHKTVNHSLTFRPCHRGSYKYRGMTQQRAEMSYPSSKQDKKYPK